MFHSNNDADIIFCYYTMQSDEGAVTHEITCIFFENWGYTGVTGSALSNILT